RNPGTVSRLRAPPVPVRIPSLVTLPDEFEPIVIVKVSRHHVFSGGNIGGGKRVRTDLPADIIKHLRLHAAPERAAADQECVDLAVDDDDHSDHPHVSKAVAKPDVEDRA